MIQKLVYLLWEPSPRSPEERRAVLIDRVAPTLLEAGAVKLQINVTDAESDVRSPAPWKRGEDPIVAEVCVWLDGDAGQTAIESSLREAGHRIAGYRVDESIYTEYGDNDWARPRDWPDGQRSPGVLSLTCLERPARLEREEWIRRWHGRQSPLSAEMQPRARYVRNVVLEAVTPDAPPYEGIVEEVWPSREHVENRYLFFGAESIWQLVRNMIAMGRSVAAFLKIRAVRSSMMGEYFIRS